MSRKVNSTFTAEQVKNAFRVFEGTAPPGHVQIDVLVRALVTYGTEKLTEDQARDLVSQLEVDSTGTVNYVEYVNMMM
jgi:calmodulin